MESDDFEAEDEGQGAGGLDLTVLLLYGIGRSRFWVGLAIMVGLTIGLVAAAAQPNVYTSIARLQLRAGKRESITTEALAIGDQAQHSQSMIDEVFLLEDPGIYQRVARVLGSDFVLLPPDPGQFDTESTSAPTRLLHDLQKFLIDANASDHECADEVCAGCLNSAAKLLKSKTNVEPFPRSSILFVYHTSSSPERAYEINKAVVEAFLERHHEEFSAQKHFEKSREEFQQAQDALTDALEKYGEHKELCGFRDLDGELEDMRARAVELRSDITRARAQRKILEGQISVRQEVIDQIPKEVEVVTAAVPGSNPEWELWNTRRTQLTLERVSQGTSIGVDEIDRQIQKIIEILATTPRVTDIKPAITTIEANPRYLAARRELDTLIADDRGLGESIELQEQELRALDTKLGLAYDCETTHEYWDNEIVSNRKLQNNLAETSAELEVLKNLDEAGDSNLRIYQEPSVPTSKDGPKRLKTLLMGLMGGLAAGVGIAVLRQLLDRHVRYPRTLEKQLGLPVLAVVPEVRGLRKLGKAHTVNS